MFTRLQAVWYNFSCVGPNLRYLRETNTLIRARVLATLQQEGLLDYLDLMVRLSGNTHGIVWLERLEQWLAESGVPLEHISNGIQIHRGIKQTH